MCKAWLNLEDIMLSGINQRKTNTVLLSLIGGIYTTPQISEYKKKETDSQM